MVKLCLTSQGETTFLRRLASHYPDLIEVIWSSVHPVSDRELLLQNIAASIKNDNPVSAANGFYNENVKDAIIKHCSSFNSAMLAAQSLVSKVVDSVCCKSSTGTVKLDTLVSRFDRKLCPVLARHILLQMYPNNENGNLPLMWLANSITDCYNRFIDRYIEKHQKIHEAVIKVSLAELTCASRGWFVCEQRISGIKIPHKVARQEMLERIMNERYGIGTRTPDTGVKCTIWNVPVKR